MNINLYKIKIFVITILYLGSIFADTITFKHNIKNSHTHPQNLFFKYDSQEEQVTGTFLGINK